MTRNPSTGTRPPDREQLRQELLKLIVKNEATRRDGGKAQEK